jgi:shikimate 5-dehydrogenase
MPFKTSIGSLLDSSDDLSSKVGAVNTVRREGASYRGFNTDIQGIVEPLRARGLSRISRSVVLGAGGTARAFCAAMQKLGCEELTVLSRDPSRSAGFISEMALAFPSLHMRISPISEPPAAVPELFFNASPLGSTGDPLPQEVSRILQGRPVVFDAVYSPVETELVRAAERKGCVAIRGHEMLLHQGVQSFRIWTGRAPPIDLMRSALLSSLEVTAR